MKVPLRILLVTLALCLSLPLVAQQTKTKTKTEAGKTKTKTETTKAKTDSARARVDTMATIAMEGTGGGTGSLTPPYTATYSSQFTIGDSAHTNMILAMWKDWDENKLDRNMALIADSIVMETPEGTMIRGKDSFLLTSRQQRDKYTTVTSTVEVFMPLRSTDRNENWVAIWGTEQNTGKDGTVTTNRLHELWRINKEGKIDFMRQFAAKPPTR